LVDCKASLASTWFYLSAVHHRLGQAAQRNAAAREFTQLRAFVEHE
jgi:hypothetical protein